MSEMTIGQAVDGQMGAENGAGAGGGIPEGSFVPGVEVERSGGNLDGLTDMLKCPTGEGPVSDYVDNALNFDNSMGLAQVLRGLSGFLGANFGNYAIVDIVVGAFRWNRERKVAAASASASV